MRRSAQIAPLFRAERARQGQRIGRWAAPAGPGTGTQQLQDLFDCVQLRLELLCLFLELVEGGLLPG